MANRNYNRLQALEKEIKKLYAQVSIGASGAPTLTRKQGITSITRNSAGNYTITLDDQYMALVQISQSRQLASGAPGAVGGMVIRSETVSSTKTIVVEFLDAAGAAVELVNGTILRLELSLKNSSV